MLSETAVSIKLIRCCDFILNNRDHSVLHSTDITRKKINSDNLLRLKGFRNYGGVMGFLTVGSDDHAVVSKKYHLLG